MTNLRQAFELILPLIDKTIIVGEFNGEPTKEWDGVIYSDRDRPYPSDYVTIPYASNFFQTIDKEFPVHTLLVTHNGEKVFVAEHYIDGPMSNLTNAIRFRKAAII